MTYKDPRDGRWRYRFVFKGKRYSGSAPAGNNTKTVAVLMEREHIRKLAERRYTGVMPTVAQFVTRYLEFQRANVKPLTYELHDTVLTLHIVPTLGPLKLDEVGIRQCAELALSWDAAPRTINTRLGILARLLSLAVEWEFLVKAPKVPYRRVAKDTPRFLTDTEATTLLEHAGAWRSMLLIGMRAGLRIGELRGLQWGDVDFRRGVLVVRRTDPGRGDMAATSPKSGRERTVAMSPDVEAALRHDKLIALSAKPDDWVWPATTWRGKDRRGPRSATGCTNAFTRAAELAGIVDISWHTLRHTCASWLVMRGVSLRAIQHILGHESIKQTERYAHLAPDYAFAAVMRLLDIPLEGNQQAANTLGAGNGDCSDDE